MRIFLLALSLWFCTQNGFQDPQLKEIRKNFAFQYMEPEAHMELAKFHHDKGNRLVAFYILESARRRRFAPEVFDNSFQEFFLKEAPFDDSENAEKALLAQHKQSPSSYEINFQLSTIYISRENYSKAKEFLQKTIELKPEELKNYLAYAEVLRREGNFEEADKKKNQFLKKFPNSKDAYLEKITPLLRKDPNKAKKLLQAAINKYPKEGELYFNLAIIYQDEAKIDQATKSFEKACKLSPKSDHIQGWTARFFLKVKHDKKSALYFYLNAYFQNPHFYDSEHAESRIVKLSMELAKKEFAQLKSRGKSFQDLIKHENPRIAILGLKEGSANWDIKNWNYFAESMLHDDVNVRWIATDGILKNANKKIESRLRTLMKDGDLRRRSLSAYIAVKTLGDEGIETVKSWLDHDAQIIRYDAIFSLLKHGGEMGKKILRDYRKKEKHPRLKRILDSL